MMGQGFCSSANCFYPENVIRFAYGKTMRYGIRIHKSEVFGMKKILSALLILFLIGCAALALADGEDFVIADGVLTKYNGDGGAVVVPDTVTEIGGFAFDDTAVTSVTVPASVKTIGEGAFHNCHQLVTLIVKGAVTVGDGAFCWSENLTTVTLPDTLTAIPRYAFQGCKALKNLTLGSGITSIGTRAFDMCDALESISLPDSVKTIGEEAFYNMHGLKTLTLGSGLTAIGGSAFSGCDALTAVAIPGSVTSFGKMAFYDCTAMTTVTVGEGVKEIGDYAFENCENLKSVTLPSTLISIGNGAFYGCSAMTGITVPKNVKTIGQFAFSGCAVLINLSLPAGLETIGANAFYQCYSLLEADLPSGLTELGDSAFEECANIRTATIPGGVGTIGACAFADCIRMTKVTILDGVTMIEGSAFDGCTALTELAIPASVTKIEWNSSDFSGQLTILGEKGSYAEVYAGLYGLTFKEKDPVMFTVNAATFPDKAFRTYITANIDLNKDGVLRESEISAATKIDLSGVGTVKDLTGIGAFTALKTLNVSNNQLTGLNLSGNTELTKLVCKSNVRKVAVKGGKLDVTTLKLTAAKMSKVNGATLEGDVLTKTAPGKVTYTYDCGGGFKATFTINMTASRVAISSVTLKKTSLPYTGKAIEPAMTVKAKVGGKAQTLKKGQYTVTYKNNVKAGTASVTVTGTGFFKGTIKKTFKITRVELASAKLEYTKAAWTGKALKPAVTVKAKVNGKTVTLKAGTDYTVTYKNNVKKGTATVTVKGKGNFTGTLTKTFTIR